MKNNLFKKKEETCLSLYDLFYSDDRIHKFVEICRKNWKDGIKYVQDFNDEHKKMPKYKNSYSLSTDTILPFVPTIEINKMFLLSFLCKIKYDFYKGSIREEFLIRHYYFIKKIFRYDKLIKFLVKHLLFRNVYSQISIMSMFDVLDEFQHRLKIKQEIQYVVDIPDYMKYNDGLMLHACIIFNKFDLYKQYYENYDSTIDMTLMNKDVRTIFEKFDEKFKDVFSFSSEQEKEKAMKSIRPGMLLCIDENTVMSLLRTNNIEFIKYVKSILSKSIMTEFPIYSIKSIEDKLTPETYEIATCWLLEKKLAKMI